MQEQKPSTSGTMTRREGGALAPWNPWSELTELRQRMDDLFSRSFGYTPLSRFIPAEMQMEEPEVDIHESDTALQVLCSLPGYTPDQIKVEATGDSFTIQGERKALFDDDKAITHRNSGVSGSSRFYFSYALPMEIDPNRIKATFANGVLQLELPKTEPAKSKGVKVNVEPA